MKTEQQLQKYIRTAALEQRIRFYKLHAEGKVGFPDVMLASRGHVVFIEVKSPSGTGRLRAGQNRIIKELTEQGLEVYVIDSKSEAEAIITRITDREPKHCDRPAI
jgi:hypothetical protein|tara:strand:- start:1351 stop:1668 length:318 start_codon:yes stop_codon:yes gene_type:complete